MKPPPAARLSDKAKTSGRSNLRPASLKVRPNPGRNCLSALRGIMACHALFLAGLILFSCAPKVRPPDLTRPAPAELWQSFQSRMARNSSAPAGFRIKASLNYSSPEENHRFILSMWGNYSLPMRLDLSSGFGSPFSLWQLNAQRWLAYHPSQERAYFHTDSREGAAQLGLKTPFGLQELSRILTADWMPVVPGRYAKAEPLGEAGYRYIFPPGRPLKSIALDRRSRVLELRGESPELWTLRLEDHQESKGRQVAEKLTLSYGSRYTAILHIKDLVLRTRPWPISSLQLHLPEDTMIVPLQYGRP